MGDGSEFDDGDDMGAPENGGDMPMDGQGAPMNNPDDMGNMEDPMGDVSNDPKFQQLQQVWSNLTPDQQEATIKYAESQQPEQPVGGEMPEQPMGPDMPQEPLQEKVVFKKKQLEEIMRRK